MPGANRREIYLLISEPVLEAQRSLGYSSKNKKAGRCHIPPLNPSLDTQTTAGTSVPSPSILLLTAPSSQASAPGPLTVADLCNFAGTPCPIPTFSCRPVSSNMLQVGARPKWCHIQQCASSPKRGWHHSTVTLPGDMGRQSRSPVQHHSDSFYSPDKYKLGSFGGQLTSLPTYFHKVFHKLCAIPHQFHTRPNRTVPSVLDTDIIILSLKQ